MAVCRAATPLWVRTLLILVLVGGPGWLLLQRHDRLGNEARLSAVASAIAGREVRVRCPGVIGRVLSWDIVEGSVRFDEHGRPADEAKLRAFACGELDAIAEGRRDAVLACVAAGAPCGRAADDAAMAVDVLAHESWHLAGVVDEAVTECRSLQTMAWAATRIGARESEGRALARHQLAHGYERLPARYRSPACVDGGVLDLRPTDPAWP